MPNWFYAKILSCHSFGKANVGNSMAIIWFATKNMFLSHICVAKIVASFLPKFLGYQDFGMPKFGSQPISPFKPRSKCDWCYRHRQMLNFLIVLKLPCDL